MAYVGEYRDRFRHGHGSYTFAGGASFQYKGAWDSGFMHGRGMFLIGDGGSYEGEFVNGEMDGIGLRRWPDGSTYSGQFFSGERHGEGVFISSSGEVYEGHWKNNQRDGDGELRYKNGDVYRGTFLHHKAHGQGRIVYEKDDSSYEGDWSENVIVGRGILRNSSGNIMYEGEWKDGCRHGNGVGILGRVIVENNVTYDGLWERDQPAVRTKQLALRMVIPRTVSEPQEDNQQPPLESSSSLVLQSPPQTGITLETKQGFRLPTLVAMSLCDAQINDIEPSQVEGESGRQIRLRVFEGPIPTPVDPSDLGSLQDTTSPAQWQFIADTSGIPPKDHADFTKTEDEMEKPRLTEIILANANGLAQLPPLALPDTSLLGSYHLVCDSLAIEDTITPVYVQLTLIE